jgi:Flp pilus assembly pilin Flp
MHMKINRTRSLMRDQRGLSTVEYTVLLVLIVAVSVGLWNKLGAKVKGKLTQANTDISDGLELQDP